jgi:Transposase DDE domain group 1
VSQSIAFALPTSTLQASFDGPQLTSEGGLCWPWEADTALGLCAALAAQVPEWRRGPVRHSLETLVRPRVFQIACGYEDQDDADTLSSDPLLKLVCGRSPSEAHLASQPTLSRLENAVDSQAYYRLARTLVALYLQERERDGLPYHIILDVDSTDDPAHGQQATSSRLAVGSGSTSVRSLSIWRAATPVRPSGTSSPRVPATHE